MTEEWTIPGAPTPTRPKPPKQKPKQEKSPDWRKGISKERKARFLLNLLKEEHNFDLVGEIIKTYREIQTLADDEVRLQLTRSVQKDLMKYCFPTLKSTETRKEMEQTLINFNIPLLPAHMMGAQSIPEFDPDMQDAEIVEDED